MIRGPTTFRDPNGERRYKIASESVPLVLVLGEVHLTILYIRVTLGSRSVGGCTDCLMPIIIVSLPMLTI